MDIRSLVKQVLSHEGIVAGKKLALDNRFTYWLRDDGTAIWYRRVNVDEEGTTGPWWVIDHEGLHLRIAVQKALDRIGLDCDGVSTNDIVEELKPMLFLDHDDWDPVRGFD